MSYVTTAVVLVSYYEDEARKWLVEGSELVRVTITPNIPPSVKETPNE